MLDLCRAALDAADLAGAAYADARGLLLTSETLAAKNGQPAEVAQTEEAGLAVRVLCRGAWGFAATGEPTRPAVEAAARLAVANARAAARLRAHPVELAPEPAHQGAWETPLAIDPRTISLDQKLDLLVRATELVLAEPMVTVGRAGLHFRHEDQTFLTTEGTAVHQLLHHAAVGLTALSAGPGGLQKRSYPNSWCQAITGGWELIEEVDLLTHAPAVAAECAALQTADLCPAGETDLILDSTQLTLQIHESVGHPLELDRVLGGEADFAGTSFATPDNLGRLRYGSELVSFTADSMLPRGVATLAWDDEGVAAQTWKLVDHGLLRGYLTSREYAATIGEERSRGCLRAQGWRHVPIIRITNVSLDPGPEPLTPEALIADTKRGLYMATNRSWSIDQRRVNFQFGCEIAREIRDGRLGRLLRNPTYQGLTTDFWRSCDAICDERSWQAWGILNCGKGQPLQLAEMSHGSSPARFRGVRCGVG